MLHCLHSFLTVVDAHDLDNDRAGGCLVTGSLTCKSKEVLVDRITFALYIIVAYPYAGVTTVPLPTNIQAEDIVKIINEAELTCLTCSLGELAGLASLVGGCETVKAFVVMDLPSTIDPDTHALMKKVCRLEEAGARTASCASLRVSGLKW